MTEQMPLYTARDETAPSILELAWQHKVRVERLRTALRREEEALAAALDEARDAGANETVVGHGVFRLDVKPGRMTRVIDVDAFRANYPEEFRKAATFTVKLADAERVLRAGRAAWPDDPKQLANLMRVVARRGGHAEARALFDELRRRFPTYLDDRERIPVGP